MTPIISRRIDEDSTSKTSMVADVKPPLGTTQQTKEDLVQTNFMSFPDSLVNQSKTLQNYTKLSSNDQANLTKMRKAEQNATQRKVEVVKIVRALKTEESEESILIKADEPFNSVDPTKGFKPNRTRNKIAGQVEAYGGT